MGKSIERNDRAGVKLTFIKNDARQNALVIALQPTPLAAARRVHPVRRDIGQLRGGKQVGQEVANGGIDGSDTCVASGLKLLTLAVMKVLGVERYKSCAHKQHGVASFRSCRHPNHGVEAYKKCSFYKNPQEALTYANLVAGDIAMMRDHLIIHKGNFYALSNSEAAMACHIKEIDASAAAPKVEAADALKSIVAALTLKFQAIFGKPYKPQAYDCANLADPLEKISCKVGDPTPLCRAKFGYQSALKWFEETKSDLQLIIDDLTKFGQKRIVEALTTIAKYLKDPKQVK